MPIGFDMKKLLLISVVLLLLFGCSKPQTETPTGPVTPTEPKTPAEPGVAKPAAPQGKVWMAFEPVQCNGNPWDQWYASGGIAFVKAPTEKELLTAYFSNVHNVQVFDYKSFTIYEIVCQACHCSRGDEVRVLINASDKPNLMKAGWYEAEEPPAAPGENPPIVTQNTPIPPAPIGQPRQLPSEEEFRACENDVDCQIVQGACCGCGGGGKYAAINWKLVGQWDNKLDEECDDEVVCTDVMSTDPSCRPSAKAVCRNGQCQMV